MSSTGAMPTVEPLRGVRSLARYLARTPANLPLRLISSLSIMTVAGVFLGWGWAVAWFAVVWLSIMSSIAMMRRMQTRAMPAWFGRLRTANNFWGGSLHAAMAVALWRSGEVSAERFAVVTVFISAFHVLQHYYWDLKTFRLMITPAVTVFVYVSWDTLARSGYGAAEAITAAASTALLVTFFRMSRQMLDAARRDLVEARAKARDAAVAAESANAAKSTFLATMSHEVRTPLNGVLGMAQAMAAGALEPVQRERLSVIHQSGDTLLAILNDVLDLSKIEAGKLAVETIDFDLGHVARGVHTAFRALAETKGLSLVLDVEAAAGTYRGDPLRLRQVLSNLISNAVKFTDTGEVRLSVAPTAGGMRFEVSDTGIGIARDGLADLFSSFSQVDASTTRRFGGTGLGLAICRELVELMGGHIEVASEPGHGSRFGFTLPLVRVGDVAPAAPAPTTAGAGASAGALRVLAAEDNAVNQLVLRTLLEQVDDGAAAVAAWADGDWDVILMDVQMPVMDGPTATRAIREGERASGRARTPIVALTANAMSHQIAEYRAAGMDGHVAKPISAAKLYEALQAAVAPEAGDRARAAAG